ncbi:hypothetical protein ACLB2K_012640 [Fragaria x ananassa]
MLDTIRIPVMPSSPLQTTTESHNHSLKNGEQYAEGINWDDLGFGLIPIDYMYTMKCSDRENFTQGQFSPFGKIELCPSAGILNYAQGLYEGLKAIRTEDGRILLFRTKENALRMKMGAERLCMPSPSVEQFVEAVLQTVHANKRWVPPPGKGSLYVRPLLMASGCNLGLGPGKEYTFVIYASPVGNYIKGRTALNLFVEHVYHRAAPGGTGGVKSVTNYSPVYQPLTQARAKGFSDILFLDSETGKNIEEIAAANIFILKGNVLSTPTLKLGTILPGITRKSIIDIARDFGYQVEERVIPVEDLLDADEAFCTGTAVIVNSVGSVAYQDKRVEYKTGEGSLCQKLYETLTGIQTGRLEDKNGWTLEVN